jgi:cytochrome P450
MTVEPAQDHRVSEWSPAAHGAGGAVGGGSRGPERIGDYERLRASSPAWSEDFGGYWSLLRYDDVKKAARDAETFRAGQPFAFLPDFNQSIPLGLNPPEHTEYRRLLNQYFLPARIDALEPTIRRYVTEHLDPALEAGEGEMISALCSPVPARALTALLNMPEGAWTEMTEHSALLDAAADDPDKLNAMIFGLFAATVQKLVADRRENPRDVETDLITGILSTEVNGHLLSDEDVVGIGVQLFGAGHGTTTSAMSTALQILGSNPGDQAMLRLKPELIPTAIEEFLRIDPPGSEFTRRAQRDVDLNGRLIRAGDLVAFNYAAANHDEQQFAHPSACIIDRSPNRHLSFGHGVHLCVGAPYARMQIRVLLEEILRRTRGFEVSGPIEPSASYVAGGLLQLPMRFRLA